MDDKELEQMLTKVLRHDYSAGTEEFRDSLLQRCLDELRTDGDSEIPDVDLEYLAAAGINPLTSETLFRDNDNSSM